MARTTETSVYIVDDDTELANSLKTRLSSLGIEAHCFIRGKDFMEAMQKYRPDCVLLEIRLPDIDGLSILERVMGLYPEIPVIMMTGYAEVPITVRVMKAGAQDLIEKPFNHHAVVEAIQRILTTSRINTGETIEPLNRLTSREHQVLKGIVQGLFSKEIAENLGISQRTVEVHRANLMEKTRSRNVAELVRFYFENLPPPNNANID